LDLLSKTQQVQTLRTILGKNQMLIRLIKAFDDKDLRGVVILVCSSIRRAALKEGRNGYVSQLLESTRSWALFSEKLQYVMFDIRISRYVLTMFLGQNQGARLKTGWRSRNQDRRR
jgi:hypothetical protein